MRRELFSSSILSAVVLVYLYLLLTQAYSEAQFSYNNYNTHVLSLHKTTEDRHVISQYDDAIRYAKI